MTAFQKKAFWLVVIAQVAVLVFMIGKRTVLLRTGKTVLLECRPVDPRSLFSGDYVILHFAISQLDMRVTRRGRLKRDRSRFARLNIYHETFKKHDTLYVALQKPKRGKYWKAAAVSHDRVKLRKKFPVVIRGKLRSKWSFRVRYGVEQYFVPQFAGKRIERKLSKAAVEVAIADSGESAVKRLFIAGKEVKFR